MVGQDMRVAEPPVKLQLLGSFAAFGPAGHGVALPRKARILLAMLSLDRAGEIARDKLASMLWDDSPTVQARASLRQMLSTLRRALGDGGWLSAGSDSVSLDASAVTVDAIAFLDAAEAGEWRRAADLWTGDLLDGLSADGLAAEAWLEAERARLRAVAGRAILDAASTALSERRHERALADASRLVAMEPLSEPGHRLVMQALGGLGRTAEALRHYRRLQELLRRELGVAPDAETIALAQRIGIARGAARPAPVAPEDSPEEEAPEQVRPAGGRTELRRVAVLAAGLADFAGLATRLEVEILLQLLLEWREALDAEAARHGGRLHQQTGDEAILLFGDRPAHDDDAVRAAAAAAALQAWARRHGIADIILAPRIGIAVGPVLVSDGPPEPSAIGAAVTEAIGTRSRAQAGETRMAARHLPELRGRIAISDRADGDACLGELLESRSEWEAGFVGRRAELAQGEALLEAVVEGAGQTLLLRGEPGIGKSRTADMLAARATALGFSVHRVAILEFGDSAAMLPRQQLARQLLGVDESGLLPAADRLLDGLGREPRDRPFMLQLFGLPLDGQESSVVEGMGAEAASKIRGDLLQSMLADVSSAAPMMIIVDDVHWAGRVALRQIADLSRLMSGMRALLLLTARPTPDVLDEAWRQRAGPLLTIDLRPLGPQEALTLAGSLGLGNTATAVAERAQGNPLHIVQLAAAVNDGVAPEDALPGTLQALTASRMDALEPDERRALEALAVLGRRSALDQVQALAEAPDWSPSRAVLGALVVYEGGRIGFVHALIRDAVLQSLLPSRRAALHLAAAEAAGEDAPELAAEHLERAGDPQAAQAWARAARAALRRHRPNDGLEAVLRGRELAASDADRFALAMAEAACSARVPDWSRSARVAEEAVALAPGRERRLEALLQLASAQAALARAPEGLATLETAERLAQEPEDPRALSRIAALRSSIHFPRGELQACLSAQRAAVDWSRRTGLPVAECGARLGLAWALYQNGDFSDACREADACLAMCKGSGMDRIRLSALRVRAVSGLFLLRHEEVIADAGEAIAMAAAQHDAMNEVLARTTLATAHLERFEPEVAMEIARPALPLASRLSGTGLAAAPLWVMGVALGSLGEAEDARARLEEARRAAMAGEALRFAAPRILGTLSWFVDPETRAALRAKGEAMLEATPVPHSALGFHSALLLASLVSGEWDVARQCGNGLRRFGGSPPHPWVMPLLAMADVLPAVGDGTADAPALAAAAELRMELRRNRALAWLRPATRAVLDERIPAG
jgi:DNA-binding SARP family transcriptional activator